MVYMFLRCFGTTTSIGSAHHGRRADDDDDDVATWGSRVTIGVVCVMLVMSGITDGNEGNPSRNGGINRPIQGKRFRGSGGRTKGAVIGGTEAMEDTFFARHLDQTIEVVRAYRKAKGLLDVNDFYGGAEHCCGAVRLINVPGTPLQVVKSGHKPHDRVITWLVESLKYLAPLSDFPNVTIGHDCGDWVDMMSWPCWANSGMGGLHNFLDSSMLRFYGEAAHTHWGSWYNLTVDQLPPWEERQKTPVWRGTLWFFDKGYAYRNMSEMERPSLSQDRPARMKSVHFSIDHPDLLDSRPATIPYDHPGWRVWKENATNGLFAALPLAPIPQLDYFTKFQCHLVLGGIGAAFRLTGHLAVGSAVVLEPFKYELWYTRFMVPGFHYIAIEKDLGNLTEVTMWVRDHPAEVQKIGANGRRFYREHLSEHGLAEKVKLWLDTMAGYQARAAASNATGTGCERQASKGEPSAFGCR